jgi:hypothetical protein
MNGHERVKEVTMHALVASLQNSNALSSQVLDAFKYMLPTPGPASRRSGSAALRVKRGEISTTKV